MLDGGAEAVVEHAAGGAPDALVRRNAEAVGADAHAVEVGFSLINVAGSFKRSAAELGVAVGSGPVGDLAIAFRLAGGKEHVLHCREKLGAGLHRQLGHLAALPDDDHVGLVGTVLVADALTRGALFLREHLGDVAHFKTLHRASIDAGGIETCVKKLDAHVALGGAAVDLADRDRVVRAGRLAQAAASATVAIKDDDAVGALGEGVGRAHRHAGRVRAVHAAV